MAQRGGFPIRAANEADFAAKTRSAFESLVFAKPEKIEWPFPRLELGARKGKQRRQKKLPSGADRSTIDL